MPKSSDKKGVSNIYKSLIGRKRDMEQKKWNEKSDLRMDTFSLRKSFVRISITDDIYSETSQCEHPKNVEHPQ